MLLFIFKSANNPYPADLTFNHGFNHGKCVFDALCSSCMEFGTGSEFHPCSCVGGNPLNGTLPFPVSLTASLDVDNIQFWV